ncbi:MAG: DUF3352 domain-containing protein [Xenococcaceae cyanobacterium MO_188.B19]|nr:DUF3352 domain-containing protein [Xenococcaceae cyanobacterium MO_188.B19]
MSSNKLGCGFLPILSLIGILGIGGGIYAYKKGFIPQELTPLRGAKVIPDEAIFTSFISTEYQDWQQIENLGIDRAEDLIKETTNTIDEELSDLNIDYQTDIQPWLGNMMLAVVPEDETSSAKYSLLVLGIKNPINAYKFFKKFQTQSGEKLEFVQHNGIKINQAKDEQQQITNIAILGNKIVVSDSMLAVKKAIDTYKGEPSFASNPDNLKVLKQPLNLKNSLVQVYLTDYDRLLESTFYNPSQNNLTTLQPLESVILGVGIEDKQLTMRSFTKLKPELDLTEAQPINNKLVSKYPAATIALFNGQGISQFWSDLVKISEQDRNLKTTLRGARYSTRVVTGLNLDKDIFGWMDGEYALGIVKTNQALIPEIGLKLGTVIILETSDRDTAQNALDSIANKLQERTGIIAQTKETKKQTITQWNIPNSDIDISYSWLDKENLLLTMGNNIVDSMNKSPNNSLKQNPKFKKFVQTIPNNSLGYFYIDMEEVMATLKQMPGFYASYDPESIAIFDSIQGVGATSTMPDSHTTKTDLVLWFK